MREKKTALKFFTVCQYQQEEDYLSTMHAQGWQLAKIIFPCFYQFEQCEPKKVAYRLDYNQEGLANKTEYVQMFSNIYLASKEIITILTFAYAVIYVEKMVECRVEKPRRIKED